MNIPITLIIGDMLLSVLARHAGWTLRFGTIAALDGEEWHQLYLFIAVVTSISYITELYNVGKYLEGVELSARIMFGIAVSFAILTALYYMLNIILFDRGVFVLTFGVFGVTQFLWHSSYRKLINSAAFTSRVVVLGTGQLAKKIGDLITATKNRHVLAGYVNLSGESVHVPVDSIVNKSNDLVS